MTPSTRQELKQTARQYMAEVKRYKKAAEHIESFLAETLPSTNGHVRAKVQEIEMDVVPNNGKGKRMFTPKQVRRLRKQRARGERVVDLAKKVGVHPITMTKLLNKHSYAWVK